ncbi:hypothetical protein AB0D48_25090, partial [Streptomyces sp. NPDC048269]
MRRTLTIAAAAAALLLAAGPLPVAGAGGTAHAAVGRWSARDAQSFWTAERMASAVPMPLAEPAPPALDRTGYDESFLGPVVPLPLPDAAGVETVVLPY